jgi:hypothetical protein
MSCIFKLFQSKKEKQQKILRQKANEFQYEHNTCNMEGQLPYTIDQLMELEGCLGRRMSYLNLLSTQTLQKTLKHMKSGNSQGAQPYILFRKEIVEEIKQVSARLMEVQEKIQKQKDGFLIVF